MKMYHAESTAIHVYDGSKIKQFYHEHKNMTFKTHYYIFISFGKRIIMPDRPA